MVPEPVAARNEETSVCVVCKDLLSRDLLNEESLVMVALAERLAASGFQVTLAWMPGERPDAEEVETSKRYFKEKHGILLEVLDRFDETIYRSNLPTHASLGFYSFLKRNRFTAVYVPLEGGIPYYTLLGKETGVYGAGPTINVVASAPLQWRFEIDREYYWSADHLKTEFMEKYCAQQADRLICISEGLREWFKEKGWNTAENCEVLPPPVPVEWEDWPQSTDGTAIGKAREIVLIASPRFRDGITLFCDALDKLNELVTDDLCVTIVGGYWRILGEHTGGMFIRRGRRWRFRLRFLPRLKLDGGLLYAQQIGAIAALPNFGSTAGYGVSECVRLGVPFVATAVGGNVEQVSPESAAYCLVEPDAGQMAKALASQIANPRASAAARTENEKLALWAATVRKRPEPARSGSKPSAKAKADPLVSIIMTHHDRPQYFLQALASVREQDYSNFEVIIVDDGSKLPASHAMLDDLEDEFKRRKWKIIRTENRYVGAARNTGVRASRGKYVVFVDDDNALLPTAVSTFVSAIVTSGSDVCTALSRNFYGPNVPGTSISTYVGWIPLGASLDVCLFECCFGDTISIYAKTIFDKVGFQLEKFGYMVEDYEFFSRITLAGLKIRVIPEPLFWYRVATQGRFRSSHFYDNQEEILKAFSKAGFKGLDSVYRLILGQNISEYSKESYRVNLGYSPSDENFLKLTQIDPNGNEAISLMATIAAAEARPDTAIGLLSSLEPRRLVGETEGILDAPTLALNAVKAEAAIFTSRKVLGVDELMAMETGSHGSDAQSPVFYVEEPDRLFMESSQGALSLAVLPAGVPSASTSVESLIYLPDSESAGAECLILFCPMYDDALVAVQMAPAEPTEGSSGWIAAGETGTPARLIAKLSTPATVPMNLVLAARSRGPGPHPALVCFEKTSFNVASEQRVTQRPRLGAPTQRLRARSWTDAERTRATLLTPYPSQLPLLLFPKKKEGGIFLRPSHSGPVVAVIGRGFPSFARELRAQVEIAHDEASSFEFGVALTLPDDEPVWRPTGPKDAVAFSGWIRVDEKFKLHDLSLRLLEQLATPLTINLAVKLPRGSNPSPANAFWRDVRFLWNE